MVLSLGEVVKVSVLLTRRLLVISAIICVSSVSVYLCVCVSVHLFVFFAPILLISHRQSTASDNVSAVNNVEEKPAPEENGREGETAPSPAAAKTESSSPALKTDKKNIQIKELFAPVDASALPNRPRTVPSNVRSLSVYLYICHCFSLSKRPPLPC